MVTEPQYAEISRRLDSHAASLGKKVDQTVYDIETRTLKETHNNDIKGLKEDLDDLKASYRRLVTFAATEAIGLLIAIVLLVFQFALAVAERGGT